MAMKLYKGDCLEVMRGIADKSIDLIICDLPYGTTQCSWDEVIPFDLLWEQYRRIIKPGRAIVLFGSEPFSSRLRLSNIDWYKYDWVRNKKKAANFLNAKKQPMKIHELISVFSEGPTFYVPQKSKNHEKKVSFRRKEAQTEVFGRTDSDNYYASSERYPVSIIEFSKDTQKSSLHPTQKPVDLIEYLIRTYTNKGDTVLDNCMGSGTTGIACMNTGREFIGIEILDKHFETAEKRIREHRNETAERQRQFSFLKEEGEQLCLK